MPVTVGEPLRNSTAKSTGANDSAGLCGTLSVGGPMVRSGAFVMKILAAALAAFLVFCGISCSEHGGRGDSGIAIVSYLVRDSVIHLQRFTMRSRVIVGFTVRPELLRGGNRHVRGELYHNESLVGQASLPPLDGPAGSLEFELPPSWARQVSREEPYGIPAGTYRVVIGLLDAGGALVAECSRTLRREELCRTFPGRDGQCVTPRCQPVAAADTDTRQSWIPAPGDLERGYALFGTSPLERVFPDTEPAAHESVSSIAVVVSRGEYKPITFSVRAVSDLGRVRADVSTFHGTDGAIGGLSITTAAAGLLTEEVGEKKPRKSAECRRAPRILEPDSPRVPKDVTRTFWLTLRVGPEALPGEYDAVITIIPERGCRTQIPLHVTVLPLTLTDTDIRYGMMMDYAFYELDSPGWTDQQRVLLARRGAEIYSDLREHGMTMAYPHSRFVPAADRNGEPVLESLRSALRSYKELGFPGPFCWYPGHLLHTAKPQHPSSILLYDEATAEQRLRRLLRCFERLAREAGVDRERLLVQVVDEPDREDRARTAAAKKLHAVAREMGFRTLITRPWPEVSVMCTVTPDSDAEAARLRAMGNEWWVYPNEALTGRNLCYTRYVFGFGAWKWGVKGVVPWTYRMSQGSNGNPFTVLDGPEIMMTYPGEGALLSTPVWEAVREGITDYRYIFRLERLIVEAKRRGVSRAAEIERRLAELKRARGRAPGSEQGRFGDWPPESFDRIRSEIIGWALALHDGLER